VDRIIQTFRAGSAIEDYCRACKADRMHTVIAADAEGRPLRVSCGFCRSDHNYRGGPRIPSAEPIAIVTERERSAPPAMTPQGSAGDLELLLRRIIREEAGLTPAAPAEKWRGGSLVLRPGNTSLQEKSVPIETFFHKIVMLRNRLRTLEQHVNASDLPDDVKVKLQAYITGCYGSLTTFNVLFADEADQFKGTEA
jgi:hypothetical protein